MLVGCHVNPALMPFHKMSRALVHFSVYVCVCACVVAGRQPQECDLKNENQQGRAASKTLNNTLIWCGSVCFCGLSALSGW